MLLLKLSEADGVSGNEGNVRALLKEELASATDDIWTDTLGNLFARKGKGKKPRVMVAAHMDEVGLMVVGYEKSGLLKVTKVGSVDDRVLVSKPVLVGEKCLPGVIGAKAIHLQKPGEFRNILEIENLYVDIGAASKEEAAELVNIGDYVAFATKPHEIGNNCLAGKAFDDRAGCAVVAELLKEDFPLELTAVFTVQEEVGLRGSMVAAHAVHPDFALVIEGTTANDVAGVKDTGYVTKLGCGPAITIMDSSFITQKKVLDLLVNTAEKHGIPYQMRQLTTAGTDAGAISRAHEGIPAAVLSVPCRYIHSPTSIINLDDYKNTLRLAKALLVAIAEGGLSFEETAEKIK